MTTIRIFRYLDDLDCFVVSDEYRRIADQLGLTEWSPVVWIGRLFTLDNDDGERWFDNWHLREPLEEAAAQCGLSSEELLMALCAGAKRYHRPRALPKRQGRPLPPARVPQALLGRRAALAHSQPRPARRRSAGVQPEAASVYARRVYQRPRGADR